MKIHSWQIGLLFLLMTFISCENPTSPENVKAIFSGAIKSASTGKPIYPVFIFEGDSLLGIVGRDYKFSLELKYGAHDLLFSAIGYLDKMVSVTINGNQEKEIQLIENSQTGRIFGEFQDLQKFQQRIAENSELENWTEEQVLDLVTGATIQVENSDPDSQHAQIFIADSLVGYADVWGQYWIKIQCGTYPLTGKIEGYSSQTKIAKVLPDSRTYVNFYLTPQ